MASNMLYYGDNLDILPRYIDSESVDLVYLDPPFNSNQTYNVLFAEKDGSASAAQIRAFEDTWHWDHAAAHAFETVIFRGGQSAQAMKAFRQMLGENDMLAYLAMMAPRLLELHRVLKTTGSLYLHCDPTASHYLKMLLDAIFGPKNYRSEIVWKRSSAHNDAKQGRAIHGHVHDIILFYTKGETWTWNQLYTPYSREHLESEYRHVAPDGRRYKETDLTAARPGGDTEYEWRVKRRARVGARWEADLTDEYLTPQPGYEYAGAKPYNGRYWAYAKSGLIQFVKEGRLIHRETGMPRLVQFSDEMPGVPLQDEWDDIRPINAMAAERLGYPTQKPLALLERIIAASSNPSDVVLDPFCGCGTAVVAAEKLGRHWIGIDITHLAISLMKGRLDDTFDGKARYKVIGEPVSLPDAQTLAGQDKYQFQWWALGLVGARPTEEKKGADRGIDGRIFFMDDASRDVKQVILSVKGGHLKADDIRALGHVVDREDAQMGVLLTLEEPTAGMRADAASAGFYHSPYDGSHPRLQILTIKELLGSKRIDMPPLRQVSVTFKRAPKAKSEIVARLRGLWDDSSGGSDAEDDFDESADAM